MNPIPDLALDQTSKTLERLTVEIQYIEREFVQDYHCTKTLLEDLTSEVGSAHPLAGTTFLFLITASLENRIWIHARRSIEMLPNSISAVELLNQTASAVSGLDAATLAGLVIDPTTSEEVQRAVESDLEQVYARLTSAHGSVEAGLREIASDLVTAGRQVYSYVSGTVVHKNRRSNPVTPTSAALFSLLDQVETALRDVSLLLAVGFVETEATSIEHLMDWKRDIIPHMRAFDPVGLNNEINALWDAIGPSGILPSALEDRLNSGPSCATPTPLAPDGA